MKRNLAVWLPLLFLFIQVWSTNKDGTQMNYEKYTNRNPGKASVYPVIRQKVHSHAQDITDIIISYLYLSPFAVSSFYFPHLPKITNLLLSHDNRFLFVGGYGAENREYDGIKIWDLEKNKTLQTFVFPTQTTPYLSDNISFTLSNDDTVLVAYYPAKGSNDCVKQVLQSCPSTDRAAVEYFDAMIKWRPFTFHPSKGQCMARCAFSNDDQYFLAHDSNKYNDKIPNIKVWCMNSGAHYRDFECLGYPALMAITRDQYWLLVIDRVFRRFDGSFKITVWDFKTGDIRSETYDHDHCGGENEDSYKFHFTSDEKWIISGNFRSRRLTIRSFLDLDITHNIESNLHLTSFAHAQKPVTNQHVVAIGGYNGDIEVWLCHPNFTTTERIHTIRRAHLGFVRACCFTTDGEKLISVNTPPTQYFGSTVIIWDITTTITFAESVPVYATKENSN